MKRWMLAAMLVVVPATAQAMSVHEFLTKANALKARGIFALGSSDIGVLKGEMAGIMKSWQVDNAAAKKQGRPIACPPPGAKRMSQNEFLGALEGIPKAQRGMSMKAAFYGIMRTRYPCQS
jgi:hypothetical protein